VADAIATATAPKPKKVAKTTKSRASPVVLIPKSAPSAAKGKGKAKAQAQAVDVDAYDIDVVEDDAFAMALEYASPAPESRPPVPGNGMPQQHGSGGLVVPQKEDDDMILLPSSQMLMPSSQMLGTSSQGTGRSVWMADVRACEKMSEEDGVWVVEGYAGMEAVISSELLLPSTPC
jgi:hypothetical protein